MQLELLNEQGQATSKVDAPDTVFGRDYNEALVHQIVVAFQANARQGTRAQMDRDEVKHSTKKPWRQKGTGRARAGMTSSPLWRGGGRIFPNSPDENFTQKVNKKMYRAGMASIFSQLAREGRLAVVDSLTVVDYRWTFTGQLRQDRAETCAIHLLVDLVREVLVGRSSGRSGRRRATAATTTYRRERGPYLFGATASWSCG